MTSLKQHPRIVLLACSALVLAAVIFMLSAQKARSTPTLLEAETITAAVEQLNLPWIVSEDDIQPVEGQGVLYSLRHQTSAYVSGGGKWLTAGISSFMRDGQLGLYAMFLSESIPGYTGKEDIPFVWEDWKQSIVLATMLYGGFQDEEELYRAVSAQSVPEDVEDFSWAEQLSGAYCSISCRKSILPTNPKTPDRYVIRVDFYQSKSLYDQLQQEMADILAARAEQQTVSAG